MLEKFFGKAGRTGADRNLTEVACPLCGSKQKAPRLVVTTFCRNCGEHLRIEKNGQVIASVRINPVPSSLYPAVSQPKPGEASQPVTSFQKEEPSSQQEDSAAKGTVENKGLNEGAVAARGLAAAHPPGAFEPRTALQRMASQVGRTPHHYFKEVECFDCRHHFKVGRSARSTACPACGSHLCLEDVEINSTSSTPVRTRGDVIIRKHGNLQCTEIRCCNLKVLGTVSAAIDCTGDFFVRSTGVIIGEVHCHRLVVEKGSDVHFMNKITAAEAAISGRILGNIHCSGSVNISASGVVQGDVTGRAVNIEPGGQLDGTINIVRSSK